MGLGLTIAVCIVVGLLIGYAIGHVQHRGGGKAAEQAAQAHDEYRADVHEHFEQTSKIMSRMVDDYREMYQHLSAGAGKLANIHPERVVTPPPAPEAITAQDTGDSAAAPAAAKAETDADTEQETAATPAAKDADDTQPDEASPATTTTAADENKAASAPIREDDKARARRLSGNAV